MNIPRLELLAAIKFLKPVIPDSEDSGQNCLFIHVDGDRVVLTGGGLYSSKKVVLVKHPDIEADPKAARVPTYFMVPKGTVEAFETLMDKHKKKCTKLGKGDPSYLYVQIDHEKLFSHKVSINYEQPIFDFKDLEPLFEGNRAPAGEIFLSPGEMSNVMTGFKKSKQVKTIFSSEDGPIYFIQEATGYEAILMPQPEEIEDEGGQTSFEDDED